MAGRQARENSLTTAARAKVVNCDFWQMGPCFGASCRRARKGAVYSPEYRRESRRKAARPWNMPTGWSGVPLSDSLGWSRRAARALAYGTTCTEDWTGRNGGQELNGDGRRIALVGQAPMLGCDGRRLAGRAGRAMTGTNVGLSASSRAGARNQCWIVAGRLLDQW